MPTEITCPVCGSADRVEKVSTLYLVGVELRRKSGNQAAVEANTEGPARRATELLLARQRAQPGVEPLQRKLTPPSSGQAALTRPIHPDLAVLAFSLIAPVFLYGIVTSQPGTLPAVLGLLVICYGLYFWQRRKLIDRFEADQARRKQDKLRTARAVERWMKLYYCANEELVFDPTSGESAPVDQMMGLVWQGLREG